VFEPPRGLKPAAREVAGRTLRVSGVFGRGEQPHRREKKEVQVDGKTIEFDKDGFMIDPSLWDDKVAAAVAGEEGIDSMSEKHWAIVSVIRDYWKEHDLAPPVRLLCKESGVSVREVYKLFASGPARGACRIAGLPKPDGCV
jgi:tRNA 2-thiouridine synthesizing protein E